MKTLTRNLLLFAAAITLTLAGQCAFGQAYSLFQPANGILKGQSSTFVTTPATSADVISLWSGSCSPTTFLRGDGSCQSPGGAGIGTVTSVGLAWTGSGLTVSNSPVTSSGTLTFSGALNVATGGTGATTLTGLLEGNGTSAIDTAESADVITLWTGTCNATTFLRGDGSCQSVPGTNDASTLTTGTLADARLSSNVPLLNAANIFTAGMTLANTTGPVFLLNDTDATTGTRRYRIRSNSGVFSIQGEDDGGSATTTPLAFTQSVAGTIASIALTSTALTHNGNTVLTATSSLPAANLTGTVADARLSSNVALYNAANPTFTTVGNNALRAVNSSTGFARVGIETNGVFRGDMCSATSINVCAQGDAPNDTSIRVPQDLHIYDSAVNQIIGTFQRDNGQLSLRSSSGLATTGTVNVELQANGGAAIGYIGDVSSVNSDIVVQSNVGHINIVPAGGSEARVSGSRINTVVNTGKTAFGKVNASAGSVSNSLNVTSISKLGTGLFTINLTAAGFTSQPACTVSTIAGNRPAGISGINNTSVDVAVCDQAGNTCNLTDINFNFICMGN